MLFTQLDRLKRSAVSSILLLMFAGFVLLLAPEGVLPFLGSVLGFLLSVYAAVSVLNFIGSRKALIHYVYLFLGLAAGLFGFVFFVYEDYLSGLLFWLVSVIPILAGAYGGYHALAFARMSGRRGWWILIVLSVFLMVFGGFIFLNPWADTSHAVMQVIGGGDAPRLRADWLRRHDLPAERHCPEHPACSFLLRPFLRFLRPLHNGYPSRNR